MKRFLKNSMLFMILFFIVEKGTCYFLDKAPDREYDKRLEYVINGEMNKDVIILGSSRGAGNILAEQIEKGTGFTSYNLSYLGSNIIFQEFIFKTLLRFNKAPKKVILAIDNPYEFIREPSLSFRLDRLYPLSKYNYINDELIKQNDRSILSKLFCLDRINTSNFKIATIKAPLLNPLDSCGSQPMLRKKSTNDLIFLNEFSEYSILNDLSDYSTQDELPEYVDAFKNIQALCKEYNIQLIFVFSPNFHAFNYQFKDRFETLMLQENKIVVYDSLNPVYKNKEYFYDISHLVKEGATIFTSEISRFINEN